MGLLMGFRRGARALGAEYVDNAVTGLGVESGRVTTVQLATGEVISCGTLVNAAGPRAQQVAAMAGLSIPVAPFKRYSFVFSSATPIPGRMPNVIDLSGTFVRPEGPLFLTGNTPGMTAPPITTISRPATKSSRMRSGPRSTTASPLSTR
ncbi:FAD-dependent oxidoreductase [Gemmobacter lanyuensis]